MIKQLGHLCLITNQLPAMVAFYTDVLGLKVKFRFHLQDGAEFGCYLAAGHLTFVEIFDQHGAARQWGGETPPLKPHQGSRIGHYCFEVTGLESYCEKLKGGGLPVTDIKVGIDHSKQAWLKDPDGNAIELMEYTPKSLQL
jgi:lactoylglutathione lyase